MIAKLRTMPKILIGSTQIFTLFLWAFRCNFMANSVANQLNYSPIHAIFGFYCLSRPGNDRTPQTVIRTRFVLFHKTENCTVSAPKLHRKFANSITLVRPRLSSVFRRVQRLDNQIFLPELMNISFTNLLKFMRR